MTELLTLDDFEAAARERLPHAVYEYIAGGAADEVTLGWNREALQRMRLRPHVLEDVSSIDTRVEIAGQALSFPILLAPVAYQRIFHPDGEVATAVHASSAIPGACAPVKIGDELYIDGGISDPLPVDVLEEMGVERIIAINTIPTAAYDARRVFPESQNYAWPEGELPLFKSVLSRVYERTTFGRQ